MLADGLFHTLKDSTRGLDFGLDGDSHDASNLIQLDPGQELELLPIGEGDDNVLVTLQLLVRMVYKAGFLEAKITSKTHHSSVDNFGKTPVLQGQTIAFSS